MYLSSESHSHTMHTHHTHTSVKWFLSHRNFLPLTSISFSFDHHHSPLVEYFSFLLSPPVSMAVRCTICALRSVRALSILFPLYRRIMHTSPSPSYIRFKGTTVMSFSRRIHFIRYCLEYLHFTLFSNFALIRCCCTFRQYNVLCAHCGYGLRYNTKCGARSVQPMHIFPSIFLRTRIYFRKYSSMHSRIDDKSGRRSRGCECLHGFYLLGFVDVTVDIDSVRPFNSLN